MSKWILHIVFFILVCSATAQTSADTIKTPTKAIDSVVTKTVQPMSVIDTTKKTTVQSAPTQTIAPVTVQSHKPKHKKPKDPYKKPDFKAENKEIKGLYREAYDKKKEIVLQNKRYRVYNNYLSAGVGQCYNSGWQERDLCTSFDFNFHANKRYFQVGGNLVGPALWNNNCIQLHTCWGYRFERCNYQLAAYGGLSFSDGYYIQRVNNDTLKIRLNAVGVYAALQCFYKLKFDYGIGVSTFFDANAKQTLVGIKLELFFSGAYKGFKRINYAKEDEKYQVP
jgi:hypothetical protein